MKGWVHKDEWKKSGERCAVVVSRHLSGMYNDENRWCVYLYIYPGHPDFSRFDPDAPAWSQPHFSCHSYVSYFRAHRDAAGNICSYQLGWDYNHDGEDYSDISSASEAGFIFFDAENLLHQANSKEDGSDQ